MQPPLAPKVIYGSSPSSSARLHHILSKGSSTASAEGAEDSGSDDSTPARANSREGSGLEGLIAEQLEMLKRVRLLKARLGLRAGGGGALCGSPEGMIRAVEPGQ